MRKLIADVLEPKMDHLRTTLMAKISAQDERHVERGSRASSGKKK